MVAVLVYAHAVGVRSSRAIERCCARDVAFRVLAGNRVPDHATIARFFRRHRKPLTGLFGQVLRLCHEAGTVGLGVIAVDGRKVAANASWSANHTSRALAHQVAEGQARFTELARSSRPACWPGRRPPTPPRTPSTAPTAAISRRRGCAGGPSGWPGCARPRPAWTPNKT